MLVLRGNATFAKGGKEKKKDAAPQGDAEAASIEELNQKISTLEKEKNKEEEYRNYMQLERVSASITGAQRGDRWVDIRNLRLEYKPMRSHIHHL